MEATMQKEVKDYMAEYNARMRDRQSKALKEVKEQLAPKYLKHDIITIELHYSGCGDSGEMTEVAAYDKDNNILTDYSEVLAKKGKDINLYDDWSEICYDLLTYDWYNNDGGGGVIYIDLENMNIEVDGYYNETVEVNLGNSDQQTMFDLNEIV